jgi:phosphoribosyl 1,2-cyclic phosphodiesterase
MLRFTSLGSGSSGNALVVECDGTRVMMDCGFTTRGDEAAPRARRARPARPCRILVTHEHDDHMGGVARFAQRYAIPVYLTRGTAQWLPPDFPAVLVRIIDSHVPVAIDAMSVEPFPVPHDAREPVQYAFSDGDARLGVVTDLGCITQHVVEKLSGCTALVIECNHDLDMLMEGPYPVSLKQRVAGRFGHLDNLGARRLVEALDRGRMRHLIAAHLSKQNNRPQLAPERSRAAPTCERDWIGVAHAGRRLRLARRMKKKPARRPAFPVRLAGNATFLGRRCPWRPSDRCGAPARGGGGRGGAGAAVAGRGAVSAGFAASAAGAGAGAGFGASTFGRGRRGLRGFLLAGGEAHGDECGGNRYVDFICWFSLGTVYLGGMAARRLLQCSDFRLASARL